MTDIAAEMRETALKLPMARPSEAFDMLMKGAKEIERRTAAIKLAEEAIRQAWEALKKTPSHPAALAILNYYRSTL
jgi:hypothetical protein